jgi:uncharacterized repeat protein (TIGR02543 family)
MKMKLTLLLVICYLLSVLAACDNIADTPEISTPIENGYGRISVSLADGETAQQAAAQQAATPYMARTVFPLIIFDKYVYTFTKEGEETGTEKTPDNDGYFTLELGNYTVEVQAFIGDEGSYTLAASGVSEQFTVSSGGNSSIVVFLYGVIVAAKGEFRYTITYPEMSDEFIISLQKWPDMDSITLTPINLTERNGITETLELEAGSYLLTILITKDGLFAGKGEAVHIYPAVITVYTKNFNDNNFLAPFPVTANNYNISGAGTFVYDGSAKPVSVTGKENVSPGEVTVFYNGWNIVPVNVGTYTVTFNVAAAMGWNPADGLPAGTITITKAPGSAVSAPTLNTRTSYSITVDPVIVPSNVQTVEYAINTVDAPPLTGWQTETTFSELNAGTTYYVFARAAENNNYRTGEPGSSLAVSTLPTGSPGSIEYYWVDKHGSLVTTSGASTIIASGGTLTITARDPGYVVKQWYLNGANTGQSGTTYIFSSTIPGKHTLSLIVEKDGKPYNTNIIIGVGTPATITFDINSATGTTPASQTVLANYGVITLPGGGGLTKTGYIFCGWNTNTSGTGTNYDGGSSYNPAGDITLYAKWNLAYTVTFNATGGTGTLPASQTVPAGTSITLPSGSGLTITGSVFSGWNTNSSGSGTTYNAGSSYTPTRDITLYAKWNVAYTVTFNVNGATGTPPASQAVAIGSGFTLPGASGLTKTGYIFGGWNTTAAGTGTNYSAGSSFTPTGNNTLYARWFIGTVTIDMYDSYGDGWDGAGALRITVNGTQIATNIRVQSGNTNTYTFNVVTGDVVQLYWVAGNAQGENSFIVYYTNMPPSPAFTTSNQGPTSWSGSNALVYRLRNTMDNISNGTLLGSFTVP